MELLIALITAYLAITLIYSKDGFIRSAICVVVLASAYAMSMILSDSIVFYLTATLGATLLLPFFRPTLTDAIKLASICLIAIFWLTTTEYVDGFAYSETLVALGVALISRLLFPPATRRYLCSLAILISFGLSANSLSYSSPLPLALSLCVGWILTDNYSRNRLRQSNK